MNTDLGVSSMCYKYEDLPAVESCYRKLTGNEYGYDFILQYIAAAKITSLMAKVRCGVCFGWCKQKTES